MHLKKPQIAIPAILIICVLGFFAYRYFHRLSQIRWANEIAIPEIEGLIESARLNASLKDRHEAFKLALRAEKIIPDNPELGKLLQRCSVEISLNTTPAEANVYYKLYNEPDDEWEYLGSTPIVKKRISRNLFRWKIEKVGLETVEAVNYPPFLPKEGEEGGTAIWKLFKKGDLPTDMVHVSGYKDEDYNVEDFFMDKFEVTNKQYKEFVDSGAYQNKDYWKHKFIKDGKEISWEEAMDLFVDQTGRPGPTNWEAGNYPDGQDDYPVCGVSWYEAAAYAEFIGRSLPTVWHWDVAAGLEDFNTFKWISPYVVALSNFKEKGPAPVGTYKGMNKFGAYDMAGNVREWCWNESQEGRYVCGGAWDDIVYSYGKWNQLPPLDRSLNNGIRCALYPDEEKISKKMLEPWVYTAERDFYEEKPVSDTVFQVYKNQFSYDKSDLNPNIEEKDESHKDWIVEKVTFDAAYEKDRVVAYLFLPKRSNPPFQAVFYFPGSNAIWEPSIKNHISFFDFFITDGRAVVYPIYKGIHERNKDGVLTTAIHTPTKEYQHTYNEFLAKWIKDLSRTIDYLETRNDFDSDKLAFYGLSWGGELGGIIPAVEERLKANILYLGGFLPYGDPLPEAHPFNYVPRIKTPTIMINGRYDLTFPLETHVKPMFDLLGSQEKHLALYDTGHYIPRKDLIRESLTWLDKYLGPVK
jgi:dienelactone hydrolase